MVAEAFAPGASVREVAAPGSSDQGQWAPVCLPKNSKKNEIIGILQLMSLLLVVIFSKTIPPLGITIGVIFNLFLDDDDFETPSEAIRVITEYILKRGNICGTFYDLGSCYGSLAIGIKAAIPTLQIIAIEKSLLRYFVARCRSAFKRNRPNFIWGNFLDHLDEPAEYRNIYLPRDLISYYEDRLSKACPPTTIFMYRVLFYKREATDVLLLPDFRYDSQQVVRVYR
jgi:hypothetical protein